MKILKKKSNIIGILMFILMIISAVLLRVENNITKIIGLVLFPIIIILGIILLKIDKKKWLNGNLWI